MRMNQSINQIKSNQIESNRIEASNRILDEPFIFVVNLYFLRYETLTLTLLEQLWLLEESIKWQSACC
jgi:hypothetical protein